MKRPYSSHHVRLTVQTEQTFEELAFRSYCLVNPCQHVADISMPRSPTGAA